MNKLGSAKVAAPLAIAALMACGTVNTGAVKNTEESGAAANLDRTTAEGMIGWREPNEVTVCEESTDFFIAEKMAIRQARLALGQILGDVVFVEVENDTQVEAFSQKRLHYPIMIGHEFKDGKHRVCAAANRPNELPYALLSLTPQEIGNSGLRRALSQVKLLNGGTTPHYGTQSNGEEILCTKGTFKLDTVVQNRARAQMMERDEGVDLETSEEKIIKHHAATARLSRQFAQGIHRLVNVSGVTKATGEDGEFSCGVAYDSNLVRE